MVMNVPEKLSLDSFSKIIKNYQENVAYLPTINAYLAKNIRREFYKTAYKNLSSREIEELMDKKPYDFKFSSELKGYEWTILFSHKKVKNKILFKFNIMNVNDYYLLNDFSSKISDTLSRDNLKFINSTKREINYIRENNKKYEEISNKLATSKIFIRPFLVRELSDPNNIVYHDINKRPLMSPIIDKIKKLSFFIKTDELLNLFITEKDEKEKTIPSLERYIENTEKEQINFHLDTLQSDELKKKVKSIGNILLGI